MHHPHMLRPTTLFKTSVCRIGTSIRPLSRVYAAQLLCGYLRNPGTAAAEYLPHTCTPSDLTRFGDGSTSLTVLIYPDENVCASFSSGLLQHADALVVDYLPFHSHLLTSLLLVLLCELFTTSVARSLRPPCHILTFPRFVPHLALLIYLVLLCFGYLVCE